MSSHVTLLDCTASRGTIGISVQPNGNVIRCSATRNTFEGIEAGTGGTIADCIASWNEYSGISAGTGSTVRNCTTSTNGSAGISCGSNCHIFGNTSDANNRGIYAGSTGNRIEGNSCTGNTTHGYTIISSSNFIARNTAHANGANYSVPAGNAIGPIIDMTAGGTIATTNPWANFSY